MIEGLTTVRGEKAGRTLTVMAGVHGNEVCGVKAFQAMLPKMEIERGTVHFILGNLQAISNGKRQVDMNMNRAFRPDDLLTEDERQSYERCRALEIMPYLQESDALLDVHSSMTPESTPFIICEPKSFDIARFLPFPIRSHGWDRIEPGGTDYYMNLSGGYGLCVECGYHLDPLASGRAVESIRTFLVLMGVIEGSPPKENFDQRVVHAHDIYFTKVNFQPTREFADFELLEDGELVGTDGEEKVVAPPGSVIIFCQKRDAPGKEAFVLGCYE